MDIDKILYVKGNMGGNNSTGSTADLPQSTQVEHTGGEAVKEAEVATKSSNISMKSNSGSGTTEKTTSSSNVTYTKIVVSDKEIYDKHDPNKKYVDKNAGKPLFKMRSSPPGVDEGKANCQTNGTSNTNLSTSSKDVDQLSISSLS